MMDFGWLKECIINIIIISFKFFHISLELRSTVKISKNEIKKTLPPDNLVPLLNKSYKIPLKPFTLLYYYFFF